jgi:hypothetical protein
LVPQFGQNLVPDGLSVPHFEHLTVSCNLAPQFEQNLAPAAFSVPHFGQGTPLGGCNDVPQLPQNFVF